jgi:hypothetical protein
VFVLDLAKNCLRTSYIRLVVIQWRVYATTTIVCGDCCNVQLSANGQKRNIGFLKKIKFWKKTNNNTPTEVDGCLSADDLWTCDAATVSMDPNVVCCLHTDRDQDGWWWWCCERGV